MVKNIAPYPSLRAANVARQIEWDPSDKITLSYRLNELAGEVGEACNVGKKIERERLGIKGSRDTVEHLAEELADVMICADLVAMAEGIDLQAAVAAKFNATSEKVGLQTRLAGPPDTLLADEGGCVTKRFVIFTRPGWSPEKKGGWLKDEHLIEFLREVMLWQGGGRPGFRATVLELTWDNDLWASSASEYLAMHDGAIGPRRARQEWLAARAKHEQIYKTTPTTNLGDEIAAYKKATAITAPTAREEAPVDNVTLLVTQAHRDAATSSGKKLNDWISGIVERAVAEAPADASGDEPLTLYDAAQAIIDWCDIVSKRPDDFRSDRPDTNLRGPAFDNLRDALARPSEPQAGLGKNDGGLAEIISDDEIVRVHGHANFGPTMTLRDVVNEGVLKYAIGYHSGSTQLHILLEHGLITKPRPGSYDASLTKKGKRYARGLHCAGVNLRTFRAQRAAE